MAELEELYRLADDCSDTEPGIYNREKKEYKARRRVLLEQRSAAAREREKALIPFFYRGKSVIIPAAIALAVIAALRYYAAAGSGDTGTDNARPEVTAGVTYYSGTETAAAPSVTEAYAPEYDAGE